MTGGCANAITGSSTGCPWPSCTPVGAHLDRPYPGGERTSPGNKAPVILYRAAVTVGAVAAAAGFGIPSAQAQPTIAHLSQHQMLRAPEPGDGGGGPS